MSHTCHPASAAKPPPGVGSTFSINSAAATSCSPCSMRWRTSSAASRRGRRPSSTRQGHGRSSSKGTQFIENPPESCAGEMRDALDLGHNPVLCAYRLLDKLCARRTETTVAASVQITITVLVLVAIAARRQLMTHVLAICSCYLPDFSRVGDSICCLHMSGFDTSFSPVGSYVWI